MATVNVAPPAGSMQNLLGSYPTVFAQAPPPAGHRFGYSADTLALQLPAHESIAPYPANAGPAAGASAVIDAENDGLLSVAAVGALVAGIAALLIPILFELSGARVSRRLSKYLGEVEAKNEKAKKHIGRGESRVFETINHDFRSRVETALSDISDEPVQQALAKLAATGALAADPGSKLHARELYNLRRAVLFTLMEQVSAEDNHDVARLLRREHAILEKLGPGDAATPNIDARVLEPTADEAATHHERRRAIRGTELHTHNRFLAFFDETAAFASNFSRFGKVRTAKTLFHPPVGEPATAVRRPRTAGEVQSFYKALPERSQPWVRAIHTAAYIDQQWPGLLQDAANAHTSSHDRFEVWIEHPIPKRRVLTDLPQPDSATRPVAVFAHRAENDAALRRADYSLGRELDVAYGNYRAFKAQTASSKLHQVRHRYALYFCGAKDTMANPRGMGMVFANLGVTSITLSALLYGMLYLVEYWKIEQDLKKANLPTGTASPLV